METDGIADSVNGSFEESWVDEENLGSNGMAMVTRIMGTDATFSTLSGQGLLGVGSRERAEGP